MGMHALILARRVAGPKLHALNYSASSDSCLLAEVTRPVPLEVGSSRANAFPSPSTRYSVLPPLVLPPLHQLPTAVIASANETISSNATIATCQLRQHRPRPAAGRQSFTDSEYLHPISPSRSPRSNASVSPSSSLSQSQSRFAQQHHDSFHPARGPACPALFEHLQLHIYSALTRTYQPLPPGLEYHFTDIPSPGSAAYVPMGGQRLSVEPGGASRFGHGRGGWAGGSGSYDGVGGLPGRSARLGLAVEGSSSVGMIHGDFAGGMSHMRGETLVFFGVAPLCRLLR
ncbi:hypothetical protein DL93DRAFT_2174023 [Clavulina sp. PMI_390]|nr:hypothetical protein DL93DRAFT_2174023 [Clavulina sp. PMI_390]